MKIIINLNILIVISVLLISCDIKNRSDLGKEISLSQYPITKNGDCQGCSLTKQEKLSFYVKHESYVLDEDENLKLIILINDTYIYKGKFTRRIDVNPCYCLDYKQPVALSFALYDEESNSFWLFGKKKSFSLWENSEIYIELYSNVKEGDRYGFKYKGDFLYR